MDTMHPTHELFTVPDFTAEEIKRNNPIATAVIMDGMNICKKCGADDKNGYLADKCGTIRGHNAYMVIIDDVLE